MKPTLIVLAAGMGSRYGGLKQLDKLGPSGETIMDYSIYDAIRAGFGKVVFVIRQSFEDDFKDMFVNKLQGKIDVELVYQELDNIPGGIEVKTERSKPWGTGHAVWVTKDVVNEPFAVLNADDFYGAEAFKEIANFLVKDATDTEYAMCGYQLNNTLSEFGSVSRGVCKIDNNGYLVQVNERTSIIKENGTIAYEENNKKFPLKEDDIVSMNFWGFTTSMYQHLEDKFIDFVKDNSDNPKAEFYIPYVIDILMNENKVKTKVLSSDAKWFGVTYKEDRPATVKKIQELVDKGLYPDNLWK
jgi:UTP-glucose-1-phosphate uridylyltransferase